MPQIKRVYSGRDDEWMNSECFLLSERASGDQPSTTSVFALSMHAYETDEGEHVKCVFIAKLSNQHANHDESCQWWPIDSLFFYYRRLDLCLIFVLEKELLFFLSFFLFFLLRHCCCCWFCAKCSTHLTTTLKTMTILVFLVALWIRRAPVEMAAVARSLDSISSSPRANTTRSRTRPNPARRVASSASRRTVRFQI